MEDAFKHFDKDGCGSITAQGFSTGLREMGVFQEFSEEEVDQVCIAWQQPEFSNNMDHAYHSVLVTCF